MPKPSGPPPIVYILAAAALGGGGWYAYQQGLLDAFLPGTTPTTQPTASQQTPPSSAVPPGSLALDTSLPDPTVLAMDGSVTMVRFVQGLRAAYNQRYPNIPLTYGIPENRPNGSNRGLQALVEGRIQIAATSRPLNATEAQAGIQAIPVAKDAIAIVVGVNNPFKGGLTLEQVGQIFQGKITNWSQVGGPNVPIRVLNRSPNSGTSDLFRSVVLLGQNFAPDGPNFITYQQDVTTPILRALRTDGISYTTVAQAENQATVRIVPIDGSNPTDKTAVQKGVYPLSRSVFFAVPRQTSPAVKNFVELALSPQGQQIAARSEFIPLR